MIHANRSDFYWKSRNFPWKLIETAKKKSSLAEYLIESQAELIGGVVEFNATSVALPNYYATGQHERITNLQSLNFCFRQAVGHSISMEFPVSAV